MKFSIFQVSRKGGRDKNEDRMGYCYTKASGLFLVADGMGGHPHGEVAAQLALHTVAAQFQREANPDVADVPSFLERALLAAHRRILRFAMDQGLSDSPRTTLVACMVQGGKAYWIHCGDSRLYWVRDGVMLSRTKDHSYAEQGADKVLAQTVNRNVLYTCLGSPVKPLYDVTGPVHLLGGDRIMLCSDGLWSAVTDADIVRELCAKPVTDSAPDLVELALSNAGGKGDNVTMIALEWEVEEHFESTRGTISTDSIEDGVFASTVQASWNDIDIDDFDDEAIERSIAEINEAIRRSAERKN